MGLGNPLHILILLLVVLLVFGAKRLPEIGRSLGDGMRGFKDTLQGAPEQLNLDHAASVPAATQAPGHSVAALVPATRAPVPAAITMEPVARPVAASAPANTAA